FRERLGIRANHGVPQPGFASQTLDGCHGVGYGFVTVSLLFSDHQQLFPWGVALTHHCAGKGRPQKQSQRETEECHEFSSFKCRPLRSVSEWEGTGPSTASWH